MTIKVINTVSFSIETLSPLSLGSGMNELIDVAIVRDANNLPTIPGSSLRGVLRHLWRTYKLDPEAENKLFGIEENNHSEGNRAALTFSFGFVHDQNNAPVQGLKTVPPEDSVLNLLKKDAPLKRDHVKLNDRHVADDRNKFDRAAVPVGTRFSFEISWLDRCVDVDEVKTLLSYINHPAFRLGGASGKGYGKVRLLINSMQHKKLSFNNGILSEQSSKIENIKELNGEDQVSSICLSLEPVSVMRIGSPTSPTSTKTGDGSELNLRPLSEPKISWNEEKGALSTDSNLRYVVPGSSIRGALAHRTLFHFNRLTEKWTTKPNEPSKVMRGALLDLFGSAKSNKDGGDKAGRLIFDDGELIDAQPLVMEHNTIDRFTGGVMKGALFSEEVLYGGTLEFVVTLIHRQSQCENLQIAIEALNLAISDLCEGRLALGAKSLGFMKASQKPAFLKLASSTQITDVEVESA